MAIELFEHNMEAYKKVKNMFSSSNYACIVHPTGTGKTYIAYKLIEDNPDKTFIWIGPSSYIFKAQAMKLTKHQQKILKRVSFNTYNWMIYNEDVIEQLKADYIILDEFHRAGAPKWQYAIQKLIKCLPEAKVLGLTATNVRYLDNQRDMAEEIFKNNIASEMGLTEAMARGILPTPTYVVSVYSYGEKLSQLEAKVNLLKNEKLKRQKENLIEKLRRALEQADGMNAIFEKYLNGYRGKIIVFCGSIEKMYEMMSKVPEWFYGIDRMPHIYHMYSDHPDAESEFNEFIKDHSNHIRLLFCVDMLNEGVHLAEIDGVILLRATESPTVYKQQIGRALSAGCERKPIIFDLANNVESLNKLEMVRAEIEELRGLLGEKIDPLQALFKEDKFVIHDELKDCRTLLSDLENTLDSNWDYYYKQVVEYKEKYGTVRIPRKFRTDDGLELCSWIERQRTMYCAGRLKEDRRIRLEEIGINLEMVRSANFERHMKMLEEYKEQYGNLDIRVHYKTDTGANLGFWAQKIRLEHKKGTLSDERVKRLDAIGFPWEKPDSWEIMYAEVKKYYDEHGDIRIPKDYRGSGGEYLADWLNVQRSAYKGGKKGRFCDLSPERKAKLDELGFIWDIGEKKQEDWDSYIGALKNFYEENGHAYVGQRYVTADGVELGKWVASCRDRKKTNHLSEDQINELEANHMVWDWHQQNWDEMYEILENYISGGGDIRTIPASIKNSRGTSLNTWLRTQRKRYEGNDNPNLPLSLEQKKKLKLMGIERLIISSVDLGIKYLTEYKKHYGNMHVPVSYVCEDGYRLGSWCSTKRKEYKRGDLDQETIDKLDALDFIWEYDGSEYWEHMYAACKEYYEKHGNIRMPYHYENENGDKLYNWIICIRKRRARQECGDLRPTEAGLTEDQIRRLDELGMKWSVPTGRISNEQMKSIKRPD